MRAPAPPGSLDFAMKDLQGARDMTHVVFAVAALAATLAIAATAMPQF